MQLYRGLFDERSSPPLDHPPVRLLNRGYAGNDSTMRRFAQLEID
jgi:hypothetical protein